MDFDLPDMGADQERGTGADPDTAAGPDMPAQAIQNASGSAARQQDAELAPGQLC